MIGNFVTAFVKEREFVFFNAVVQYGQFTVNFLLFM